MNTLRCIFGRAIAGGRSKMPSITLFKKRKIKLTEFPYLFQMEGHTGGFGAFFVLAWCVLIYLTTPNILLPQLFGFGAFFIFAFVLLLWASFVIGDSFAVKIRELDAIPIEADKLARKDKLEEQVRYRITILSGFYVVVCCLLIWVTGGLLSPFIPFYIMVFTLTIEKCDVPNPGLYIFFGFAILILLTFAAFWFQIPPISTNRMADIFESAAQKGMYVFFVIASLAVPTISKYWVNEAEAKKIKEESNKKG